MTKLALVVVVVVAAGALAAAAAFADGGGATIASAPELPIGPPVVGGANAKDEFWRIQLSAGDLLTINHEQTTERRTCLYLYRPTVTDFTWGRESGNSVVGDCTDDNGKSQLRWIATGSGRWIMRATAFSDSYGYQLTALVQRFTSVRLTAPSLGRIGRPLRVSGVVSGASGGKILLRLSARGQKPITTVAPLATNGSFKWAPRPARGGAWRLTATYFGDASHRPSKTGQTINVA